MGGTLCSSTAGRSEAKASAISVHSTSAIIPHHSLPSTHLYLSSTRHHGKDLMPHRTTSVASPTLLLRLIAPILIHPPSLVKTNCLCSY
eukprot:scaffold121927_cov45-Cyclotella_meneghiniana.AAC.1